MSRPAAPPPTAARWLEPFAASLWVLFWIWTVMTGIVWVFGIGEAEVAGWFHRHFPRPEGGGESPLQTVLGYGLAMVDPVWVSLAVVNCYAGTAAAHGLCAARRWYIGVFLAVLVIAFVSAKAGYPLGPITFTGRLGARLGSIPAGMPMLWCMVIAGSRELARWGLPRASHGQLALGAGLLATLTDLNLEPIAWKWRAFWLWYVGMIPAPAWPPPRNYLTWLVVAAVAVFFFRPPVAGRPAALESRRPAIILVTFNAILLLTHAARWLGR